MFPSRRRSFAGLVLAAVGLVWAACGDSNTGGPGDGGVGIPEFTSCPNISVTGASATGEAVTFSGLAETGGTPPVTTTCAPASGTVFPVGTTTVGCTARDAINRSAVCSFTVTLTASARLGAMHFLAFGDSTTAGENGIDFSGDPFPEMYVPPPCGTSSLQSAGRALGADQSRPQYFDPSTSYPQQLLNLLKARFPGESFVLENEGSPGESAAAGNTRLVSQCLPIDQPNVLLLLEGINDIAGSATAYEPTSAEEQQIVGDLQSDVSAALRNGVSFAFVSTILPVANCSLSSGQPCRGANPGDPTMLATANASIDQVNTMIRAGVGGATIVDGNAAFKAADATLASLIDVDGLHPAAAGYAVLAQAWMNAIVGRIPVTTGGRASFPQFSAPRSQGSSRR